MAKATCSICAKLLDFSAFGSRQKKNLAMGKPAMCGRCSPAALPPEQLEQQKQLEVAEFFYKSTAATTATRPPESTRKLRRTLSIRPASCLIWIAGAFPPTQGTPATTTGSEGAALRTVSAGAAMPAPSAAGAGVASCGGGCTGGPRALPGRKHSVLWFAGKRVKWLGAQAVWR